MYRKSGRSSRKVCGAELEHYENANKTDDPAYQKLLFERLYKVFICRLDPWPDPVQRSLDGWNQHVYNVLQGRSEFEATGRMKGWDRWADLPKIKVRTLKPSVHATMRWI